MGSQTYLGLWTGQPDPTTVTSEAGQFSLGLTMYSRFDQKILGMAFFRNGSDPANHIGIITFRGAAGARNLQRSVAFARNAAGSGPVGWQHAYFSPMLLVPAGQWIDVITIVSGFGFVGTPGGLSSGDFLNAGTSWTAPQDGSTDPYGVVTPNGRISTASALNPNTSLSGNMVGLDVLAVRA